MRRSRNSCPASWLGNWGLAFAPVVGGVLLGRVIRNLSYLLSNRLPGPVLYGLGSALALVIAVEVAPAIELYSFLQGRWL